MAKLAFICGLLLFSLASATCPAGASSKMIALTKCNADDASTDEAALVQKNNMKLSIRSGTEMRIAETRHWISKRMNAVHQGEQCPGCMTPRGTSNSQVKQDEWALNKVANNPSIPKVFVDIGARDGSFTSNTKLLEENGWAGTCLEPFPTNFEKRMCKMVKKAVVTVKQPDMLYFNCEPGAGGTGTVTGWSGFVNTMKEDEKARDEKECKQMTVPQVLASDFLASVPKNIGYISLDIEGAELGLLEALPADTCAHLVTIEANGEAGKVNQMRQIMKKRGCKLEKTDLDDFYTCDC